MFRTLERLAKDSDAATANHLIAEVVEPLRQLELVLSRVLQQQRGRTNLRLRDEGYRVDVPATPEELLLDIIGTTDPVTHASATLAVAARMSADEYRAIVPEADRIAAQWGEPPGALTSDGRNLLVH